MDPYYNTQEFKELLNKFEQYLETQSYTYMDAEELTNLAEYYHINGQLDKGWKAIDLALNIFPGATLPLAFKARYALIYEEDIKKAKELAAQITDKTDLEYRFINGEIMIAEDKADKADKYFAEYEDMSDDYKLDITNIFNDYGQYERASKWLKTVEDKETDDYKELYAQILVGKGMLEEGENLYNQLIDNNPYSSPYWNQLATTQMMRNHIQESITSSEFSIAINPNDSDAVLNKANGLFSLGNYKEAVKYYGQHARLCPDSETGPLFQGLCFINMIEIPKAVSCLEEAEQRAKTPKAFSEIYQELAYAHSSLGHVKKALSYIAKAKKTPCDPHQMEVLRGHVYLQNNYMEKALKEFEKAITGSHADRNILMKIAVSGFDCGYQRAAYNILYKLLKTADDDWTDGYAYLARCSYELNKMSTYKWAVGKAVEKNPEEARYVLNDLYPDGTEPEDYLNTEILQEPLSRKDH